MVWARNTLRGAGKCIWGPGSGLDRCLLDCALCNVCQQTPFIAWDASAWFTSTKASDSLQQDAHISCRYRSMLDPKHPQGLPIMWSELDMRSSVVKISLHSQEEPQNSDLSWDERKTKESCLRNGQGGLPVILKPCIVLQVSLPSNVIIWILREDRHDYHTAQSIMISIGTEKVS